MLIEKSIKMQLLRGFVKVNENNNITRKTFMRFV